MRRTAIIGQVELELLRYITEHHPITVREVAEHVARTKGRARTTVLTEMERLRKKGYLTRCKVDGIYQYSPSMPKEKLMQTLVSDFVEKVLEGSLSPFVTYLSEAESLSDRELEDLRRLVRDLESHRKEGKA